MLKKEVTYTDVNDQGEEIERAQILRFAYTLAGIKLYEQHTGRNFFEDSQKATQPFAAIISVLKTNQPHDDDHQTDTKNPDQSLFGQLNNQQIAQFLPIISDPTISAFLIDAIPAFYAKYEAGYLVQNAETYDEALDSMWLMELVNIDFFMDLFGQINQTFGTKIPVKKSTGKK